MQDSEGPNFEIKWSATEAVNHDHNSKWYLTVGIIFAVVAVVIILLTIFKLFTVFTAVATGAMAMAMLGAIIVSSKKPYQELEYKLTPEGLSIQNQLHPYGEFRAFGVNQLDNGLWQLSLIPVKRFGMTVTAFIGEDQGEQIVDILGARLPMEEIRTSFADKLIERFKL